MSLHKTGLAVTYRVISVYVAVGMLTKCKKCIESLSGSKIASASQHKTISSTSEQSVTLGLRILMFQNFANLSISLFIPGVCFGPDNSNAFTVSILCSKPRESHQTQAETANMETILQRLKVYLQPNAGPFFGRKDILSATLEAL